MTIFDRSISCGTTTIRWFIVIIDEITVVIPKVSKYANHFNLCVLLFIFCLPNAEDQPDHGIKYLRVGAVANTLCHGLGCIQLLGRLFNGGYGVLLKLSNKSQILFSIMHQNELCLLNHLTTLPITVYAVMITHKHRTIDRKYAAKFWTSDR